MAVSRDDERAEDRPAHAADSPTPTVRLPVSTAASARRSLTRIGSFLHDILEPRTYGRIAYLMLALPLGIASSPSSSRRISVGVSTAVTLIGIPILIGTVYAWRWLAVHRAAHAPAPDRRPVPEPVPPRRGGRGPVGAPRRAAGGPGHLEGPRLPPAPAAGGIASFTVAVVVLGAGAGLLLAPAWYWAIEPAGSSSAC